MPSDSWFNAILRKSVIGIAHAWVWGTWLEHKLLPTRIIFSVYDRDIELLPFVGKKVVVEMRIVDENSISDAGTQRNS